MTAAKLVAEDALAEAHIRVVTASKSGDVDALEAAQRALSEAETKARLAALAVVKHLDAAALALVKQQAKKESAVEAPPVVATWEVKEATDPRCTPCVCPLCVPPVPTLYSLCVVCFLCPVCGLTASVLCAPSMSTWRSTECTAAVLLCVYILQHDHFITSLLCVLDCCVCLIARLCVCSAELVEVMLVAATSENLSLFEAEISQLILAAADDEFDELDGPADEQLAGVSLVRQVSSKSNALSKLQTAQVVHHYCQLTATVHCSCSLPVHSHCSISCSCHLIIHLTAHCSLSCSLLTVHCSLLMLCHFTLTAHATS